MKFSCLGRLPTIGDFYDESEHGASGMLDFVVSCYESLTSSELLIINV